MIYMITNTVKGKSYIGQTTQALKVRFQQHWYQRNNETYKGEMYIDMRDSNIEDWTYCELEGFDDEKAAIRYFNTEVPNGYNKRGGSKQVAVKEERYRGQPIRRDDGKVFKNAQAAAEYIYKEEAKGKTIISCKTNLLTHLKGKTMSCYGYTYEIVEDLKESAGSGAILR